VKNEQIWDKKFLHEIQSGGGVTVDFVDIS